MPEETVGVRLRVIQARQFARDMFLGTKATQDLGRAVDATGRSMNRLQRRSFLMNQTLFTMRRYTYNATLAFTAAAVAAASLGLKFNANMEKMNIAFTHLLGTEEQSKEELKFLFDLAQKTAFEFGPLTTAARQFMAFGFSVEETNRTLAATADAISILGLSTDVLDRVIYAFSQMQAAGKITGEELRQLKNAGIPAARILGEELGIAANEMGRIGQLNIPAQAGIAAIVRGMEREFKGGAEMFNKTVTGQTMILRDAFVQMMGSLTTAPFALIAAKFPGVIDAVQRLQKAADPALGGGTAGFVKTLDDIVGGSGLVSLAIETMMDTFESFTSLMSNTVLPVLKPFLAALIIISVGFQEITQAISSFMVLGGRPLILILQILVFWWLAETTVKKISVTWTKIKIAWDKRAVFWENRKAFAIKMTTFWTRKNTSAVKTNQVWSATQGKWIAKQPGLWARFTASIIGATAAMWGFTIAVLSNPITWIIVGILAFAAALVILWIKFEQLRPVIIAITLLFFPLVGWAILIWKNFDKISAAVGWLWKKLKQFANWLKGIDWVSLIPGAGFVKSALELGGHIPGLAGGGMVGDSGIFRVGEAGPETVFLPRGSVVQPTTPFHMDRGEGAVNVTITPAPVNIDGKEVAQVVFKHRLDRVARR